mgnify:FL=1
MTTYINVHRVKSIKVETTNLGEFKTIDIKVESTDGNVELTLFTYDFDLEIEG